MKNNALSIALALVAGPAFGDTLNDRIQVLEDVMAANLIELTDPDTISCADFSGIWNGACQVTIDDGQESLQSMLQQNVTVTQTGCQKIAIDGQQYSIEVAINKSSASEQGFKTSAVGAWWSEDNHVLGFASEVKGLLYADRIMRILEIQGELTEHKDGTISLKKKVLLKNAQDEDGVPDSTMKYLFDCNLSPVRLNY